MQCYWIIDASVKCKLLNFNACKINCLWQLCLNKPHDLFRSRRNSGSSIVHLTGIFGVHSRYKGKLDL